jgi:hypothetical protein
MIALVKKYIDLRTVLLDLLFTAIVLLVPTLSHLTGFPFYVFEPMRLLVISYLLFTRSKNSYFLAISLPLFSFLVAGHPVLFKMPLVAIDLLLNVAIFNFLSRKWMNIYFSVIFSVLLSKIVYYLLKSTFISLGFLGSGLFETSIYYQLFNVAILSGIGFLYLKTMKTR